jgi:hypothetical protein
MLISILRKTVFRTDMLPKDHDVEMTPQERALDYLKYVVSFCVISMYFLFLMYGIWTGESLLGQSGVHIVGVFVIFCCCILFLALLEGLQVAILVRETKDPDENNYKETHPRAYALMTRATHEKNVRRFLIGRQFFVIFVVFLINQCTIFPDVQKFGFNPVLWFFVVQLGLPTALNVLCFAQLPAQLLGNQDPMLFMNRPGPRFTLEVCLFTEMTGIAHFSWVATAISMATWYTVATPGLDEIAAYKDLESVNDNKNKGRSQTEDATSVGATDNNTDGGYNKVTTLELESVKEQQDV